MKDIREQMVYEIKTHYGLNSPAVLSVMLQIPREKFVQPQYKNIAYHDGPVSIGHGQTMSQPYTVAFMTDLLDLTGRQKVLEIGTGSGYQAAVLAELASKVYTVEIVPELAKKAKERLTRLGYHNVFVKSASGEYGWREEAPYDAVIITAALEKEIPKALVEQTKAGGVIVAPIGPRSSQTMTRFTKMEDGTLKKEEFQKYVFVPFVEKGD